MLYMPACPCNIFDTFELAGTSPWGEIAGVMLFVSEGKAAELVSIRIRIISFLENIPSSESRNLFKGDLQFTQKKKQTLEKVAA